MISKKFDSFIFMILIVFLFLMLTFSSVFTDFKFVLLIILMFFCLIYILQKKKVNLRLLLGIILFVTVFSTSLIYSNFNGFEVDFAIIKIYIFTPISAFLISSFIDDRKKIYKLSKILLYITSFICFIDFIFILETFEVIPEIIPLDMKIFGSTVVQDNYVETRISNHNSLIFLLPFMAVTSFFDYYRKSSLKKLNIFVNIVGFIIVFFSGRRALQITYCLSWLFVYLINIYIDKRNGKAMALNLKKLYKLVTMLIILVFVYFVIKIIFPLENPIETVFDTILSAFDKETSSGIVRSTQSFYLLEYWFKKPIFGFGLSAYCSEFLSSVSTKWSYEFVYLALLMQTGIVGFTYFFTNIFFIILKNFNKFFLTKDIYFLASMIGFICFIIAGATNPMIDAVWCWAIVLVAFNINRRGFANE